MSVRISITLKAHIIQKDEQVLGYIGYNIVSRLWGTREVGYFVGISLEQASCWSVMCARAGSLFLSVSLRVNGPSVFVYMCVCGRAGVQNLDCLCYCQSDIIKCWW